MKKHCSGLDVSEHGKGRGEARGLGERELVFRDGVDWGGFAGIKGEERGVGRVYPGLDVEGVASVSSTGHGGTCTSGLKAYKEDTRQNKINIFTRCV